MSRLSSGNSKRCMSQNYNWNTLFFRIYRSHDRQERVTWHSLKHDIVHVCVDGGVCDFLTSQKSLTRGLSSKAAVNTPVLPFISDNDSVCTCCKWKSTLPKFKTLLGMRRRHVLLLLLLLHKHHWTETQTFRICVLSAFQKYLLYLWTGNPASDLSLA